MGCSFYLLRPVTSNFSQPIASLSRAERLFLAEFSGSLLFLAEFLAVCLAHLPFACFWKAKEQLYFVRFRKLFYVDVLVISGFRLIHG